MEDYRFTVEPGKQEIVIEEVFDAPRDVVFDLYNDPDLMSKWWGPSRLTTMIDKIETRPGGSWRVVQRDTDGTEYGFHGVIHDIVRPEYVVRTFEWEGMPGHVLLEVARFEEIDGKTRVRAKSVFESVEDRDGMAQSGMEEGVRESHERFTKLLSTRKTRRAA